MEMFVAALLVAVPLVDGASAVRRAKERRLQRDASRATLGRSNPCMAAWLRRRLQEREGGR